MLDHNRICGNISLNTYIGGDVMEAEERLLDCLQNGRPILFLGAGFSYKALNHKNEKIELASGLANKIYTLFYEKNKPADISDNYVSSVKDYSLKDLCTTIKRESSKRKEELYDFLIDTFKGSHPDPKGNFHELIQKYPWERIYTLNIDDLVENVYSNLGENILVQNDKSIKDNPEGLLELFKLHGCIKKRENSFIFSTDEYIAAIDNAEFKLKEFANDYYKSDIIFLGTELDEDDITYILNNYLTSGYEHNKRCFYISPSVKPKLLSMINADKNNYVIYWDTEKFLKVAADNALKSQIDEENLRRLKSRGMQLVDEILKHKSKYYQMVLYSGYPPFYEEILDGWDIVYPKYEERKENLLDITESMVIAVHGRMYVGKTCLVRRIIVDFYNKGYIALEFRMENALDFEMLSKYIQSYAENTRFAILVEDASQLYRRLYDFIDSREMNQYRVVFVTTSSTLHHVSKRHELILHDHQELYVDPTLTYRFSCNAYEKLKDKNHLGVLSKYADTKKETIAFIKKQKDIINLLYLLTHGKGFQEYFEEYINNVEADEKYFDLFYNIAIFSCMQIDGYPKEFFVNLHKQVKKTKFLNKFGDIIYFTDKDRFLKVRCGELVENIVLTQISPNQIMSYIRQNVLYLKGMFSEKTENIWSDYFQLLTKESLLKKKLKIDYTMLQQFYADIEKSFEDISYYWMQRAVLEQHSENFDQAEIFINNALRIRPESYQAKHALAKNWMERALKEINEGTSYSIVVYLFEEGEKGMVDLIKNPRYSRSFCYSVHAYLDMKIKYCKKLQKAINEPEIKECVSWIIKGLKLSNDKYMNDIKKRFIDFSSHLGYADYMHELLRHNGSNMIMEDIEEYLI